MAAVVESAKYGELFRLDLLFNAAVEFSFVISRYSFFCRSGIVLSVRVTEERTTKKMDMNAIA